MTLQPSTTAASANQLDTDACPQGKLQFAAAGGVHYSRALTQAPGQPGPHSTAPSITAFFSYFFSPLNACPLCSPLPFPPVRVIFFCVSMRRQNLAYTPIIFLLTRTLQ